MEHDRSRFAISKTAKFGVLDATEGGSKCACSSATNCKKRRLVKLDVLCPYTLQVVVEGLKRRKEEWEVTEDCTIADLHWGDYEMLDWPEILSGRLRGSAYCIRKGLSRKAQLSRYLAKYISKTPESPLKHALPLTIVVDTWEAFDPSMTFNFGGGDIASFGSDHPDVVRCMQLEDKIDWALEDVKEKMNNARDGTGAWILKASTLNKGAGVHFIQSFDDLRRAVLSETDIREWVLQSYIEPPLLYRGRKFHCRVYVLCVGSICVYFCEEVLILSSSINYPQKGDFSNPAAHISNTAVQTSQTFFQESECVRLLSDLEEGLAPEGTHGVTEKSLLERMKALTSELFNAFKSEFSVFQPLGHCFEHYGLDFMVDDRGVVWLLEVNPGPDFKQTGAALQTVIANLMEDTMRVCLDGEGITIPVGSNIGHLTKIYEEEWSGSATQAPTMRMI